jgi:hypothetical protein
LIQAAEQNNMDPAIVQSSKKIKTKRAPKPPNPFTGEIDEEKQNRAIIADHAGDDMGVRGGDGVLCL